MRLSKGQIAALTLILIGVNAPAQTSPPVALANVELRIGMNKDSVLAKFAVAQNTKLVELGPDWYWVSVKTPSGYREAGDLTFTAGKLTRVCVTWGESNERGALFLVKALYSALAAQSSTLSAKVWASSNTDANNPIYEVHLMFADREIVVSSITDADVDSDSASVKVYFLKLLRAGK